MTLEKQEPDPQSTSFLSIEGVLGILDSTLDSDSKSNSSKMNEEFQKSRNPVLRMLRCSRKKLFTIITIFVVATILFTYKEQILKHVESSLFLIEAMIKTEMDTSPIFGFLLILFIEMVIFNFLIPAVSIYNILIVYIIKNFLLSWILMMICCVASSFSTYILLNSFFKPQVDRAIEKSRVLKLLIKKMEGSPYKLFFLIKLVALPELIRNMFIGAVGLNWSVMVVGNFIFYFFLTLKYAIIGSEISQIEDILRKPSAWSEKSTNEKLGFVLMSIIVTTNILFAGVLAVKIK